MEDPRALAPQQREHGALVLPGIRLKTGGVFQEVVVVGGGKHGAVLLQRAQGVETLALPHLQSPHTLVEPRGELATGGLQPALDLLGGREKVIHVPRLAGGDLLAGAPRPVIPEADMALAVRHAVAQEAGPRGAGCVPGGTDGDAGADDDHDPPVSDGVL